MYYDVIVIGGGHAGAEAGNASARLGARTLLVTSFLARVGQMSCNPAIGGVAKGTVAREVDAMGGLMGLAADRTTIHFRMLNQSKGPAVWAPRAQCDRGGYSREIRRLLEEQPGLELYQGTVASLKIEGDRVTGVCCSDGSEFASKCVILTAGTFLRGSIRIGVERELAAGRAGDAPTVDLADQLRDLGLEARRFKTGTPPRVDGRTVNFSELERQDGEDEGYRFSHWETSGGLPRLPCWIARAGGDVKRVVEENLGRSALYGGVIASQGPRYCPSIEDKIVKFPDATGHQVFLEPEGLETTELYVNGLSTSLPPEVQRQFSGRGAWPRTRPHDTAGLRHRVRLLPSPSARPHARAEGAARSVPGRPGQRHHRLRRGRRTGSGGRRERRSRGAGARTLDSGSRRGLHRGSRGRPCNARSGRALSDCSHREPSSGSCFDRTTRCRGWARWPPGSDY